MAKRTSIRAATFAALFVWILGLAMVLAQFLVSPVLARMRVDRLTIEPAGGGAARALAVEMAESNQEKSLGLMFRTRLGDEEGMLFPYGPPQEVTMWMHNTYIPLDMVFIRSDGVIHRIEVNAEPLSDRIIASGGAVSAVLEMAGGASQRLGIKPGDTVRHALFNPSNPQPAR